MFRNEDVVGGPNQQVVPILWLGQVVRDRPTMSGGFRLVDYYFTGSRQLHG